MLWCGEALNPVCYKASAQATAVDSLDNNAAQERAGFHIRGNPKNILDTLAGSMVQQYRSLGEGK